MTIVRVKGFQIFKDRHGRLRCYHRQTGLKIDLSKAPLGSPEFFAECARIVALAPVVSGPGTLGDLILRYRSSPAFLEDIAPRTRADYQRLFDYLKPIADMPLISIDTPFVARVRDRAAAAHGRKFGNYARAVLSIIFGWGLEPGYTKSNPAVGAKVLKRAKDAPQANRPWSDEERFVVIDAAPWHLKVPIALAMYTGLREGDVVAISRSAYDGSSIERRTNKSGELVWWPVPRALKHILDGAPSCDAVTLAVNSYGRPWTVSGLGGSFRKFLGRLKREGRIGPGLTFHGLRHTVATILSEEGFDDRAIADALGQKTEAMARHYSRRAKLQRKMTGVVEQFDRSENERRTKSVKPTLKAVKPD